VICNKLLLEKKDVSCSTHPHNIYLEIITNQGLLGLSIFILFIAVIIISFVRNLTIKNLTEQEKLIIILFSTILIAELWPLRSYGSIFQTINGSIFWFFLSLISSKK
jgi:O-antigen ligase